MLHQHSLLFIAALLMFPVSVVYASGPLITGGGTVAEPWLEGARVHLVSEDLRIDLRPVRDKNPVHIVARYALRNDGPPQRLSLFFVASGSGPGSVRHQGRPIPAQAASSPPEAEKGEPGFRYELLLESGAQVLEIDYFAEPEALHRGLVDSYTLDYGLTPARGWTSFGTLRVHVQVPEDFEVLEAPKVLSGHQGNLYAELQSVPTSLVPHHSRDTSDWHADPDPGTLRLRIKPKRGPYLVLESVRWLGVALAVLIPLGIGLSLVRRVRTASVGSFVWFGSLVASLSLVYVLPLMASLVQKLHLIHSTPQHVHLMATIVAWVVGAALTLAFHVFARWAGQRRAAGGSLGS